LSTPHYAVIVPVYNSEQTLLELFERLQQTFAQLARSFVVIFIEDCGHDNSWQCIKSLQSSYPTLVIGVQLAKNFGQHNAILCGLQFTDADYVITIDDDLQTPPEEIITLIEHQIHSEAEVVYGVSTQKQQHLIRRLGSHVVRHWLQYGAGKQRQGSSFRLISRRVVQQIRQHQQHFIYIDELLQWYTQHFSAVEVVHQNRKVGKSGYSLLKLLWFTLDLVVNYTAIPLRIMTYSGLFFSVLFLGIGVYYIYEKLMYDAQVGFTSLIVAIFFTTSIMLFCLGIIGDYLRRIYMLQNQQPQYSIKKILR